VIGISFDISLGTATLGIDFDVNIGKAACEACSASWNLCARGLGKTKGNFDRDGVSD
jgi:hypothetical protein